MRISIDTNILIGILNGSPQGHNDFKILQELRSRGEELVVCGIVYTELTAHPRMDRPAVEAFLSATGIITDFRFPEAAYASAADANYARSRRRRRSGQKEVPRRVAADFLIGAHAVHCADRLMTRNPGDFRDFDLDIISPEPIDADQSDSGSG